MVRGTTPTLSIIVENVDFDAISTAFFTVTQCDVTVLERNKTQMSFNQTDSLISISLTQDETLSFEARYPLKMQLRIKTSDGTAYATQIITASVDDVLKDGEI